MIYIKRVANADVTRQIDLTLETANSFFSYNPEIEDNRELLFFDENTSKSCSGTIKKSGHSITIVGEIFSYVKGNCEFGDIIVFSSSKNKSQYKFHVIKKDSERYTGYDHALNLFGSKNGTIQASTHLIASIDETELPNESKRESVSSLDVTILTAIRTKPFLLLAGISGTGKSRIVRELARACWESGSEEYVAQKPRNFEMIQVKPNWHDSSELLGYVSRINGEKYVCGDFLRFVAKAWSETDIPYFLCLDEMNLAPVEQYFAEFLSILESRKLASDGKVVSDPLIAPNCIYELSDPNVDLIYKDDYYYMLVKELVAAFPDGEQSSLREKFLTEGISLPQNLIVIGTVNMDETTYAFSRKVLDRAMTIEMNEVDLHGGLTNEEYHTEPLQDPKILIPTAVEGKDIYPNNTELCDRILSNLQKVNDQLENTPFKIAYRTRNEFLIYAVTASQFGMGELQAFDEMVCMKILPRVEGDQKKVGNVLDKLQAVLESLFGSTSEQVSDTESETDDGELQQTAPSAFESKSLRKLKEMKRRLNEHYYCSFWN